MISNNDARRVLTFALGVLLGAFVSAVWAIGA
jgi:hypothetical protein